VFARIASAIERAPSADTRPTCWTAAHTRKCDGMPTLGDVSGSAQRAGQADVVLLMGAQRAGDRLTAVKVAFGKVREKDAEDWPPPVEYVVTKRGVVVTEGPAEDTRPIETRIEELLDRSGPMTRSALAAALGRSKADIQAAIDTLFSAGRLTGATFKARNGQSYPAIDVKREIHSDLHSDPA
jgi:hypothetical protein